MDAGKDEPIEVEVVRLPVRGEKPLPLTPSLWRSRFAPVMGGLFLDVVHFFCVLPLLGLLMGSIAGWWLGGRLGLPLRMRSILVIGSALYCATPRSGLMFLGTLVGAFLCFQMGRPRPR